MVSVNEGCSQGFPTGDLEDTSPPGGTSGAARRAWWFSRDSMFLRWCGGGRRLQREGLGPKLEGMCRPPLGTLQILPTCLQQGFPQRDTVVQMWSHQGSVKPGKNSRCLGGHAPLNAAPYAAGLGRGEHVPLACRMFLVAPRPFSLW